MPKLLLWVPIVVALASPSGALLLDQEPTNESTSTASIQILPTAAVNPEGGMFTLRAGGGDLDFIGIGGLVAGDVVTVSTTPMVDPPNFELPDTIAGIFDSAGTALCIGDDAFNNDLDVSPTGYGSLCRYEVSANDDYFVGVTGYSFVPFDGSHIEEGAYTVSVTVMLPEPGVIAQFASGLLGLAALEKRRVRRWRAQAPRRRARLASRS